MNSKNEGKKYIIISVVIIGLAFFGITPLTVRFVTQTILGNPAVDTNGMAIVNIATIASIFISIILGMVFAIIGIAKSRSKMSKN
ncbi:MAG: hypothetical protein QG628_881 [Patescibacteria group bacterium]|nr:hypothetical protein [Patescibacteria group bacterium]